ncbi:Hypothetical protein NocV09_10400070 [Nannochloropsis oceanica]
MTSSTSNPAAASSYTAPSAPRARRSSLPTTKELLAGLDMFLHLCAPPGKYRLVRILGFYYIMTRIFLTFVATLLLSTLGQLIPALKPSLRTVLMKGGCVPRDTITQRYQIPVL